MIYFVYYTLLLLLLLVKHKICPIEMLQKSCLFFIQKYTNFINFFVKCFSIELIINIF